MKNFSPAHLRKTVLDMAFSGATVHIPCAFSIIEIISVLYERILNLQETPQKENTDHFILSKGHGVMAVYAALREQDWLTDADIKNYFKDGTKLKGLSDCHVKGLEATTGSLGHGLSVSVGMALGLKLKKSPHKVYCIVGDGEANEGSIWEALLFAAHRKLDNLVVIFDCNGFQAMGTIDEIMTLEPLKQKISSFNFDVEEINGHDLNEIELAIKKLNSNKSAKPKAVIARTVKGKGISFMESQNQWHYTRLDDKTYKAAISELGY